MAPVDDYRASLAARRRGVLALVALLWARLFDPARPVSSLAVIGALAGAFTVQAQRAATLDATRYLAELTDSPGGWVVPPGLVGSVASGRALTEVTSMAPAVYWAKTATGTGTPAEKQAAAMSALALLNNIAASEPYRAANQVVVAAAASDPRLTGLIGRKTAGQPCRFCRLLAGAGYQHHKAGFKAHANCQCTADPQAARKPRRPVPAAVEAGQAAGVG